MLLRNFRMALWVALLLVNPVGAQEEGASGGEAVYIQLKPPFVVNYGGPGRLRYMKVEVSVRMSSPAGANAIRHHMPYIRNDLILLFSRQDEAMLDTQEGKELLRQEAHEAIDRILLEEDGKSDLVNVFFNQLVLQK